MDALTQDNRHGINFSRVEKGRAGIGLPFVKGAPKAALLNAAYLMVGRTGAPLGAPKTRAPCDSGETNPVRPTTQDWSLCGRFIGTVTRRAVMDDQRAYCAKIWKLQDTLLTADGLIKAIDQLSVDALESSDVCNAVHCLIETLQRLSTESINLADQLIASGRGR
jgi:hypothetical protein